MGKLIINKDAIRRGLALVGVGIVGTGSVILFSGCSEKGWQSDDHSIVQERVNEIYEIRRHSIISKCISLGTQEGLSADEINLEIYRKLDEAHLCDEKDKAALKEYEEKVALSKLNSCLDSEYVYSLS